MLPHHQFISVAPILVDARIHMSLQNQRDTLSHAQQDMVVKCKIYQGGISMFGSDVYIPENWAILVQKIDRQIISAWMQRTHANLSYGHDRT